MKGSEKKPTCTAEGSGEDKSRRHRNFGRKKQNGYEHERIKFKVHQTKIRRSYLKQAMWMTILLYVHYVNGHS